LKNLPLFLIFFSFNAELMLLTKTFNADYCFFVQIKMAFFLLMRARCKMTKARFVLFFLK